MVEGILTSTANAGFLLGNITCTAYIKNVATRGHLIDNVYGGGLVGKISSATFFIDNVSYE